MRLWTIAVVVALSVLIRGGLGSVSLGSQDKPPQGAQAKPASEKEARELAVARLKQLATAFHLYLDEHKTFPPAALVAKDGKALLSWRVLLLPYMKEEKLFREFNLAEPWDSAHNRKLLAKMPALFAPTWGEKAEVNTTPWQVFTGPQTMFEGTKGCRISDIPDGTVNVIMVVEASRAVPWTKPEDLPYDGKKDIPKVGYMFPGVFLFATADAAPHLGRRDFNVLTMRRLIMRNDGNIIDFEGVHAKTPP
jgi:hypothetical protein